MLSSLSLLPALLLQRLLGSGQNRNLLLQKITLTGKIPLPIKDEIIIPFRLGNINV